MSKKGSLKSWIKQRRRRRREKEVCNCLFSGGEGGNLVGSCGVMCRGGERKFKERENLKFEKRVPTDTRQ